LISIAVPNPAVNWDWPTAGCARFQPARYLERLGPLAMTEFTKLIFAWNDWVVFPVFTLVALVLHIRRRRHSTRLLFVGLVVLIVGQVLLGSFAKTPLHIGYIIGLGTYSLGLVAAIVGVVWFLRKDYAVSSKQA
jgi:hypothetical protein